LEKKNHHPKISLLKGAMIFQYKFPINGRIEDYWDIISNTERVNRAIGTTQVEYNRESTEFGFTILHGKTNNLGIISEYIEHPYEWVEYKYLSVYREYSKGPVKRLIFLNEVIPTPNGFILEMILQFVPSSSIYKPFIWYEANKNAYPRFKKLFEYISKTSIQKFEWFEHDSKKIEANDPQFIQLKNKFSEIEPNETLVTKLTNLILNSPDHDLIKIRPFRVAKSLVLNPKDVLFFFLRTTKLGFFDMNWDIVCPFCRGVGSSASSLKNLEKQVHCHSCNIDYNADFDQSVEVTFTPHPNIRKLNVGQFCMGGPGNTPHIRSQLRIMPEEERDIELTFYEGMYKIYALNQLEEVLEINIDSNFGTVEKLVYPQSKKYQLKKGNYLLKIKNPLKSELLVKIERTEWLEDIVTANLLTTLQEFRDLFSSEVLRPGQEISVRNITILFTDLKGSTEFYNRYGDALAFKMVGDHFEILMENAKKFNGAIVKTIGDAIMAVFINPGDAIRYSLVIQQEISNLNKKFNNLNIQIKIGIHLGTALAVNLNERLDYFGTTVNQAARIEGKCRGGDIVFSKDLYEFPGIKEILVPYKIEKFSTDLKGFMEEVELVRVIP
jgi:adenylate cyclase